MKTSGYLRLLVAGWLSALILLASEHHGMVTFGGLPVPGVSVTAIQGEKKVSAITDGMGEYSFPDLSDGTWNVQLDMSGFSTIKQDVTVGPDAMPSTWVLKLKSLSEIQAQVQPVLEPRPATQASVGSAPAAAPAKPTAPSPAKPKPTIQAAAGGRGGAPAAGTAAPGDAAAAAPAGAAAPAEANSQAADGFLVNGSQVNGGASPFALNPAFGNNRRGPRSLYTYGITLNNITLSELNARSFSQTGQDTSKPQTTAYTIQGTVQGPLRIPHLLRNGPTFGINYFYTRNRNPNTLYALVPTEAERIGDLSSVTSPIINPATQTPFTGNIIPQTMISPQAAALLGYYPAPNFNSTQYNYQIPSVAATNSQGINTRLNKQIGRKNSILGTFAFTSTKTSTPSVFGFLDTGSSLGLNIRPQWNHQFTNRLSSQLSYQFTRNAQHVYSFYENRTNVSGLAQITGNLQSPEFWGPPNLNFSSGITSLTDVNPSFLRPQTGILSDLNTWNHGRHTVQFGADFRRQELNYFNQTQPRGLFNFTGAATQVPGVTSSGSDLADFLLGIPDSTTIGYGNADKYLRASTYDAFINDDWRVNSALTINGGLRWDYSAPVNELYGRLVNLDIAPGFTSAQPVIGYSPTGPVTGQNYPSSLIHPDWRTFEPRIGLAWRPISGSSLVVRAGYALSYSTSVYTAIAQSMYQQSPLSKSFTVYNGPTDPLTLANGFVSNSSTETTSFAVDPNFKVGYAQNWNVSIQKDLPGGMQMVATYTGIKGTRMTQTFDPNTYAYGGVSPCPTCPVGFTYETSNGDSTREAGGFQLRRRLHNGLTAQVQYTYAKAIDDVPSGAAQNWLDLSAERGLSNFDQRHNIQAQLQYTSGMGIGGGTFISGWKAAVLKEWTFLVPISWGTGLPLNPNYQAVLGGTGFSGPLRPDFTGAPLYAAPAGLSLNPAAFAAPALGEFGNAGRNSITGPDQFSLNASMARTFRVNDRTTMTLTVASTNALNHVVFSTYGATLDSRQLGVASNANAMRSLLTSFRFNF